MTPHHTQQRSGVRLVSTLGLGQWNSERKRREYQPICYQYQQQKPSLPVTHIQKALFDIFQVSSCCIALTASAKQVWVDQADDPDRLGREAGIWHQSSNPTIQAPFYTHLAELQEINKPQQGEAVLFDNFNVYYRFLQDEALTELGEQHAPHTIIFDTTHGFRTQPIVGMAAVLFVMQDWSRRQQEDPHYQPPNIQVIYGAFEAKHQDESNPTVIAIAPIWEISPFIRLQQLNNALSALIHYGRHEAFHDLITQIQRAKAQVNDANHLPEWLIKLQDSAQAMSLDLGFIRSFDLGRTSAPRLRDCVTEALQHIPSHPQWSMLEPTLNSLKAWTDKLTLAPSTKQEMNKVEPTQRVRELTTPSGLVFLQNLASHYRRLGHFSAFFQVVNEGYISKQAYEHAKPRKGISAKKDVATLRNSIAHAQFDQNQDSVSSDTLYQELEQVEQDFSQLTMGEAKTREKSQADTLLLATKEELHPKMGDLQVLTEVITKDLPNHKICDFEGTVRKKLKGIAHPIQPSQCSQAIQRFEELSVHIKGLKCIVISPKRSTDFHFALLATCVFNRLGVEEVYRLVPSELGLQLERCFVAPQLIFS